MIEFFKKNKTVSFLFLIGVICLFIGVTYAFFNVNFLGEKVQELVIGEGSLFFRYDETGDALNLTDEDIISDEEGKISSKYFNFEVSQTSATPVTTKYYIYLTKDSESNLDDSNVKIYLTDQEDNVLRNVITLNKLAPYDNIENSYYLYENIIFTNNSTKTDKYRLRVWVKEGTSQVVTESDGVHTLGADDLTYKFTVNVKADELVSTTCDEMPEDASNANAPSLASNMIPVCYNSEKDVWIKADSTNTDSDYRWYSYDGKMWANAVTVTEIDGARSDLVDAAVGTPIPMERINTMLVWIPRFNATKNGEYNGATEFKCENETYTTQEECKSSHYIWEALNPGAFNITFVNKDTAAHDAFTFGSQNLSGMWIGKFENSSNETCEPAGSSKVGEGCNLTSIRPKILPNATSWRGASVSTFFYDMQKMADSGNQYGFDKTIDTTLDTHMLKNNEWGAVAYLTQSIYGRCTSSTSCTEVGINNNSSYITGYGVPSGSSSYPGDSAYVAPQAYNTTQGMDASTTGNIYGVYDMRGGAYEYVMGVYTDDNKLWSGNSTDLNSGFNGCLGYNCSSTLTTGVAYPSDDKYYNLYTTSSSYTSEGLQHALTETSGWYDDYAFFVNYINPWFDRGGDYNYGTPGGIFYFDFANGTSAAGSSSRSSIIIN